jgi:hypothetical protein
MREKLGCGARELRGMFNRILGMTPCQFLERSRCLRAIELHLAGMPYKVLLEKLKFKSSGHFCRIFNLVFGEPLVKFVRGLREEALLEGSDSSHEALLKKAIACAESRFLAAKGGNGRWAKKKKGSK